MTVTKVSRTEAPKLHGMLEIWPLSAEQYEQMMATGILAVEDPVEFVDGYLVRKDPSLDQSRPQLGDGRDGTPCYAGRWELWPLSSDQYERMISEGILGEDDAIELLDGYLVALDRGGGPGMPPNPEHSSSTGRLNRRLTRALPDPWLVRCQDPVRLGPAGVTGAGMEPQPDVFVIQGPEDRYAHRRPGPEDLRLIVEVSETSLASDRDYKQTRNATAGIPLYWIVNLVDRQLEVYSDPDPATGQYRSREILTEDQQVVLRWEGLTPITFAVKNFLP
jgi:Uma2 family endonuclease